MRPLVRYVVLEYDNGEEGPGDKRRFVVYDTTSHEAMLETTSSDFAARVAKVLNDG